LFVAGEIEIISTCKSSCEKQGRIGLLKRLMYLNSTYEFATIKTLYAAILRDIEIGLKQWSDDFSSVENAILPKNSSKPKGATFVRRDRLDERPKSTKFGDDEKVWFCSPYQRNKCLHKGQHTVTVKGRLRWALHICASCWQKDSKKLEHPECSSACPYSQK